MRLLVTGDRNWRDAARVKIALIDFIAGGDYDPAEITLISGDAKGADTYADVIGQLLGCEIERHPANWAEHGHAAGPRRNKQMLESGVDYCLAFHDDLGASRGTKGMVELLEKAGVPYKLIGKDTR